MLFFSLTIIWWSPTYECYSSTPNTMQTQNIWLSLYSCSFVISGTQCNRVGRRDLVIFRTWTEEPSITTETASAHYRTTHVAWGKSLAFTAGREGVTWSRSSCLEGRGGVSWSRSSCSGGGYPSPGHPVCVCKRGRERVASLVEVILLGRGVSWFRV